ncbi:hypothetical protein [Nostoc sp. NIES-3756]|nr:hypothetical protein [Nostoc sp. NIES-3756]
MMYSCQLLFVYVLTGGRPISPLSSKNAHNRETLTAVSVLGALLIAQR